MPVGGRIGTRIGTPIGARVGSEAGGAPNPLASVPRDATSLVYRPSTLAQWQTVLGVAGVSGDPFLHWRLDQASGAAADSIGALAGGTTGTGANFAFQQAIPGWSAVGVTLAKDADAAFVTTDVSLPDTSTGDLLVMGTIRFPAAISAAPFATIAQLGYTYATRFCAETTNAPAVRAFTPAATASGASNPTGAITPFALLVDRTNTRAALLTRFETIAVAIGGAGKGVVVGGDNIQTDFSAGCTYWDVVAFQGVAARKTNANIKAIWQTLGWTVSW